MTESTTLCIELNAGDHLDGTIFRIQRGWTLRFILGRGLYAREVNLSINPGGKTFKFPEPKTASEFDAFVEFKCTVHGSFRYEFTTSDPSESGTGYFHVFPDWTLGDKKLSLNSLSCVTHLAKLLGPLNEWKSRLEVAHLGGYNLVHLTPIQALGISNSSYSIADYHAPNPSLGAGVTFDDVNTLVRELGDQWGMLFLQDVVWNHAAKNSPWLQEHPECSFNCVNSPHLRPAYVLDRALVHFSREIGSNKFADRGLPAVIDNNAQLGVLWHILRNEFLPSLKLYEFFQINVDRVIDKLATLVEGKEHAISDGPTGLNFVQDFEFRRVGSLVDLDAASRLLLSELGHNRDDPNAVKGALENIRNQLNSINKGIEDGFWGTIDAITNATMGGVEYERVAGHGPKYGAVTDEHPLVTNYFLHPYDTKDVSEDEAHAYDSDKGRFLMACNGWVMSNDPMKNFAQYPSMVYFRRELIAWGDCIKLNYGEKPEDCPYLWEYMTEYTVTCAKIFQGLRIDNCHSTPIHVAEYLLNKAREIRPDIYVVAELFTGDEYLDNVFVNRLGITSLIREAQNAPDSHEQGRFVYRYGGDPVGAFTTKDVRPAPASVAHALFFDQTHDNPPPVQKRTAYDHVPTAAMTSIAFCASGSTRGYDEFMAYHVDVVKEDRLYATWPQVEALGGGMVKARKLFSDLHFNLCAEGYSEIFVDQINPDIVGVTRHNPVTHESVLLVSHCAFSGFNWSANCRSIHIADDIDKILFEVKTVENSVDSDGSNNESFLAGNPKYGVEVYENVPFAKSSAVRIEGGEIHFTGFPSGSVIAFKIKPKPSTTASTSQIRELVTSQKTKNDLKAALKPLSLQKLNFILFRCEKEDQSEFGEGSYDLPNVGKFVYCGIEGIYPVIKKIQQTNDLGHPLCANLRDGLWLVDYINRRLRRVEALKGVADIFEGALKPLEQVPHFLRPAYFEMIFAYLRSVVVEVTLSKLDSVVYGKTTLGKQLGLNSVAFLADIASARMPPVVNPALEAGDDQPNSLSAGLPHFAEGIWRNWGRDTFIALPGLLLATGRFDDAKNIILAFAGALRHGLIPNLLGEGKCSRYNCRDAVWFWLFSILEYVDEAPEGAKIFDAEVLRIYPQDDSPYTTDVKQKLHETMNEALQKHYAGISFRERNAGHQIDEQMQHDGFNVEVGIDEDTGFVRGGNRLNCGTWMDKMGSSEQAGNKGLPATPRDGAAVELQGLAVFVADNLDKLHKNGVYPYDGLKAEGKPTLSWSDWASKLRKSFEKHFYVEADSTAPLVNKREIIKDTVGASEPFADFQLRPNFVVALAAVPDLLPAEKAWKAIEAATKYLIGPLGIKTLDPEDWAYHGDYNNDEQSHNKATAHGWNYHQGPEWVWLAGLYLKALVLVAKRLPGGEATQKALKIVKTRIYAYKKHIATSDWRSLPELTNSNGSFCPASCAAQAWSIGCLIEALAVLD
uniref:Glycogen debranching enzyme n=1 Tax=Panagrellus redivivus TaxID=6233 RepID=A0A7E4ZTU8_PANRE